MVVETDPTLLFDTGLQYLYSRAAVLNLFTFAHPTETLLEARDL
jgi:hypothetical protein